MSEQDPDIAEYQNSLMSFEQREAFMEESIMFRGFTKNMRARLLLQMQVELLTKGQSIISEGERSKGFVVIVTGEATVTKSYQVENRDKDIGIVNQPLAPLK